MIAHVFKSSYGQCDCRWCGRGNFGGLRDCPVTIEMRRAVKRYAAANGRTWKSKLSDDRMNGRIQDADLQRFCNTVRPSVWMKIRPGVLELVGMETVSEPDRNVIDALKDSLFELVGRHVYGQVGDNPPFVKGTLEVEGADNSEYSIAHDDEDGYARFSVHNIACVEGRKILFKPFA